MSLYTVAHQTASSQPCNGSPRPRVLNPFSCAFPQSTIHATRCYTVAWLACSLFAMVLTALLYLYMTPQHVLDLQKKVQRLRHESFPPRGFVHAVNPPFNTCRNVSVSLYTCSVRSPQRFNVLYGAVGYSHVQSTSLSASLMSHLSCLARLMLLTHGLKVSPSPTGS